MSGDPALEKQTLEEIAKTFDEIRDLVLDKSRNYGVGKIFESPRLVPCLCADDALLTRLSDKIGRFENLLRGEHDRVGESLDDTARDMIGYLALWLTYRRFQEGISELNAERWREESPTVL
ncbi:MAG: hypothetical protein IKU86_12300 [Thermoguttaceae bacterium]|nr:hypothetical protein [Thermoguttaceae bacterium]